MVGKDKGHHPKLEALFPIADGIAQTFGKNAEVVVHDLRQPEKSLIYMAGNITGRKLGAPITNLVLETLKKNGDQAPNLIGYQTTTKDGKILKSSTIFIRDDDGKIIGCLCINLDITELITCQKILEYYTRTEKPNEPTTQEEFFNDVNDAMAGIVQGVLADYPVPVQLMEKDDKLIIVKKLDEKGVFLVRGAVEYVANVLGVSRYTVYNYLDEVRSTPLNTIT
ncbi:MAG TPA: transcriptional regulator [Clostridia bacterium]|nr:transcriptional regulator [Clostridia bacterium]